MQVGFVGFARFVVVAVVVGGAIGVVGACEPPAIDDVLWHCTTNSDCGDRLVCNLALQACMPPGPPPDPPFDGAEGEGEGEAGEGEAGDGEAGEGEGEGHTGVGTREDPIVLDGSDTFSVRAQTFLQGEVCYAVKMPVSTRLEVQTSGLCADRTLSDTYVRVFEPDLTTVTAEDDDGAGIGYCSFLVTPPLVPATRVICVSGYQGTAVDATVDIRLGEQFAARDAACTLPSVLRGCDPAAIDYNDDAIADSLSCVDNRCVAIFHVATGESCVAGVDICDRGECASFASPTETVCGDVVLLDDGAACRPDITGIRCDVGVRCLPSTPTSTEHTCQDCTDDDDDARPLLWCGRPRTYDEAQAVCAAADMRLVAVRDAADNEAIAVRAQTQFGSGLYWLGLDDIDEEGTFTWSDGRVWHVGDVEPFAAFQAGEPNNFNGLEHCVQTFAGGWNDNRCTEHFATVCEPHD